jgi:hypothetical protein
MGNKLCARRSGMKRQPASSGLHGIGAAATPAEPPIVAAAATSQIAREIIVLVCEGGSDANLAEPAASSFFGGVPQFILYDNTKIAVARILGDGSGSGRAVSPSCNHYSEIVLAGPARATTRSVQRNEEVPSRVTDQPLDFAIRRMGQRVRVRASDRRVARPPHSSRPYPGNERRQLQAQSEQATPTPCQLGYAGG